MKLAASLIALVGIVVSPLASGGPAGAPDRTSHAVPVLAELFTSEGCSSCPPAERLLGRLLAQQPIPGVRIIALGEHVDYWNYLGWRDRYSSAAYSRRQSAYQQRVFPSEAVYTPQLVVDGHFQAVGSDARGVRRAIEQAAKMPMAEVDVTAGAERAGRLPVTVHVDAGSLALSGPADIVVAVVENGIVSKVARGENRGRTLQDTAVLRRLTVAGTLAAGKRKAAVTAAVPVGKDWKPARLRVVAFLQAQRSRRVLGAASVVPVPGTQSAAASSNRG